MVGSFQLYPGARFQPLPESKFITLTLKPKYYKHSAKVQLLKTIPLIKEMLSQLYTCEGSIVAELTDACNVHYHLWIKFTEPIDILRIQDAWRQFGFSHVTPQPIITESQINRVKNYMDKQAKERNEIFGTELSEFHFVQTRNRIIQLQPAPYGLDDSDSDKECCSNCACSDCCSKCIC